MKDWVHIQFLNGWTMQQLDQYEDWLEVYIGERGEETWNWYIRNTGKSVRAVLIRHEEDAIAFRLKFGI